MGGADRSRRAHSRVRRARVSRRDVGPARSGRARAARGHARRARAQCADAPRVDAGRRARPTPRRSRPRARCSRRRRRPLVLVGGSRWDARRVRRAARASPKRTRCRSPARSAARISSTTAIRNYAGDVGIGINPKLAARVRDADVLLVIGERLGEMTTSGYTLLDAPRAAAAADPRASRRRRARPRLSAGARHRGDAGRVSRRDESRRRRSTPARGAAAPRGARRVRRVARAATGARRRSTCGRSCSWLDERAARRRDPHQRRRQLHDVAASALSAIAASARSSRPTPARWATACRRRSRRRPCIRDRVVVSWNGDGCFLMNGQELATAVQYGLAVIFVVVDNGMYGTIRMHQERTLSGARLGHRSRQSGFRRARARLRRARRDRDAHRRIRAGVRARAGRAAGPRCCT